MSENDIKKFKDEINDINKRLNDIVHFADTKKNFYDNVFFPEKDKNIPMTLYNTDYNSSSKDFTFNDAEILKQYNFDQPDKIFLLPSSDESGNESKNIFIPSFNQICDDIVDLEFCNLIGEEKDLPKGVLPLILFRMNEPLTSMNKVMNYIKTYIQKDPYEIKIFPIFIKKDNKDILSLSVKFYEFNDAKIISERLKETLNLSDPVRISYDKRELPNSEWYCVVFRMEGGGDQKLSKFVQLMDDIFKEINDDNKQFLVNSVEGTCEGQINEARCIRKLGEVFYCMIRVSNLDLAVSLCVKYNNFQGLQVNLHNLTYKAKKKEIPQILIDKDGNGAERQNKNKMKKSFKEDDEYEIANLLFNPGRNMLSKKHKRKRTKKNE